MTKTRAMHIDGVRYVIRLIEDVNGVYWVVDERLFTSDEMQSVDQLKFVTRLVRPATGSKDDDIHIIEIGLIKTKPKLFDPSEYPVTPLKMLIQSSTGVKWLVEHISENEVCYLFDKVSGEKRSVVGLLQINENIKVGDSIAIYRTNGANVYVEITV